MRLPCVHIVGWAAGGMAWEAEPRALALFRLIGMGSGRNAMVEIRAVRTDFCDSQHYRAVLGRFFGPIMLRIQDFGPRSP